jgi:hypothetical protein
MKLNRTLLLSITALVVVGLLGVAGLRARSETPKPAAPIAKAAPAPVATDKAAVAEPLQKPGCDDQDDDDAQEVKNGKKIDRDDIEEECGDQDDDRSERREKEKEDGHHEGGGKTAIKHAGDHGTAALPKPPKGR